MNISRVEGGGGGLIVLEGREKFQALDHAHFLGVTGRRWAGGAAVR